jgi:hypothetical protein
METPGQVKRCFRWVGRGGKAAKDQVYSLKEERKIKLAKNAMNTTTRKLEAAGTAELDQLQRKAEAIYRCLWNVSRFKKQLEGLQDADRGLPDLADDVDCVNAWLDRLADTVMAEKTKTQYVRESGAADVLAKAAWWAANELPSEMPARPATPPRPPTPPLTIEDLEEMWAETSRGVQTESDFSRDAALLAAIEDDVKLRWAPRRMGSKTALN